MISVVKRLALARKFYDADKHYAFRNWMRSAQSYSQIVTELGYDAKSLAAAKVFSRLAVCNFNLNERVVANVNYEKLVSLLGRMKDVPVADKNWLFLHAEYLGQLIGCDVNTITKTDAINLDAVSSRIREDFPVTDLGALIEADAN